MDINGATNGLSLYEWAKHKSAIELLKTDWLNKVAEEIPDEDLASYNPAINILLLLILETKNGTIDPQRKDEQLTKYRDQLKKEKIFALISKDEKEKKQNHLSN